MADLARRMANHLDLDSRHTHDIFIAGLLHEIGKVGFGDDMLGTATLNIRQAIRHDTLQPAVHAYLCPRKRVTYFFDGKPRNETAGR